MKRPPTGQRTPAAQWPDYLILLLYVAFSVWMLVTFAGMMR